MPQKTVPKMHMPSKPQRHIHKYREQHGEKNVHLFPGMENAQFYKMVIKT